MADLPPKRPPATPDDQAKAPERTFDGPTGDGTPDESFDDPPTSPMIFTSGAEPAPAIVPDALEGRRPLAWEPPGATDLRRALPVPPGQRETLDQPAPERERTTGRRPVGAQPGPERERTSGRRPAGESAVPPAGQADTLDQGAPVRERTSGRRAAVETPAPLRERTTGRRPPVEPPSAEPERISGRRPPVEPAAAEPERISGRRAPVEPAAAEPERISGRRAPVEPAAVEPERTSGRRPAVEPLAPQRERRSGQRQARSSRVDVAAQALAPQDDAPETTAPAMQTHELAPEPGTDLHGDAGGREARARRLPLLVIGAGLTLTLLFGLYWAITTSGPGPANPSPLKPIGRPAAAEAPPDKPPAAAVAPRVPARPVEEIFVEETVTQAGKPTVVKRPASVVKLVTRPEVTVYLGNKELGRTPLVVTLPEGPAQLRFEDKKLGLSKQVTYLAVAHQRTTEVIEFSQGWLDVQAPIFAKVIIDGAAAGTVPLQSVALYEGQHRVEVELASGERSARIVTISAGLTVTEEFSAPDQNRK